MSAKKKIKCEIPKELRAKANDFLNSEEDANNLVDILNILEFHNGKYSIEALLQTLEVIFIELLKRGDIKQTTQSNNSAVSLDENTYNNWIQERYNEAVQLILCRMNDMTPNVAEQALETAMKLLSAEMKFSNIGDSAYYTQRFRVIIENIITTNQRQTTVIRSFKEYLIYPDIVYACWYLLPNIANKDLFNDDTFACNYLQFIQILPIAEDVLQSEDRYFNFQLEELYMDYNYIYKHINLIWKCIMEWRPTLNSFVHEQLLLMLLNRLMPHIKNPINLTDFLIESLECGGKVQLLAIRGVFTLIQEHNITYPNIYAKLYSMFNADLFYMKYKEELFYFTDIFLYSTNLSENLVASFVKRLARLCLKAPPQDIINMLYIIRNSLKRFPGLKRMIAGQKPDELLCDPYLVDERDPLKTNANGSCLWEIILLQSHVFPKVAETAKLISKPLRGEEWCLSDMLDKTDEEMFDDEINQKVKTYALAYMRPNSLALVQNDQVSQYWKLF